MHCSQLQKLSSPSHPRPLTCTIRTHSPTPSTLTHLYHPHSLTHTSHTHTPVPSILTIHTHSPVPSTLTHPHYPHPHTCTIHTHHPHSLTCTIPSSYPTTTMVPLLERIQLRGVWPAGVGNRSITGVALDPFTIWVQMTMAASFSVYHYDGL